MSPFWKNVNDELQYQGMNIKTLAALIDVPYTTVTNARNRPNSIPSADIALRIAKVLGKSLEWLLEEDFVPDRRDGTKAESAPPDQALFAKYAELISALEALPPKSQEAIVGMVSVIRNDAFSA